MENHMHVFKPGDVVRFNYPTEFKTLPEYTARIGSSMLITHKLGPDENESDEVMFGVVDAGGWSGHAYESELELITPFEEGA